MNGTSVCSSHPDDVFGPVVAECARAFDFTLLFEESILSILPSAILILLSPARLLSLRKKQHVVGGGALRGAKLAAIFAHSALQVVMVTMWALRSSQRTKASVATAILNLVSSMLFAALSLLEHSKSLHGSILLNTYLFFSIIFDATRTRTMWNMTLSTSLTIPFTAALGLKVVILGLEELNKTKYIHAGERKSAPEETAGIFSRSLFLWLNKLIFSGFSNILRVESLPEIDRRLCSESLWSSFGARWENTSKQGNHALFLEVMKTFKWPILAPIFPLLCIVALTVSQPLLIQQFMNHLNTPDDGSEKQRNIGYGLVAAYGLVFISVAIATAWAQQCTFRFVTMIRGCLVTIIYRKTTSISTLELDDAAAVSLMSTDVERIVTGLALMHDIWKTLLQIGIALFLLYRLVWAAFVVPLALFLICGVAVSSLAGQAGVRQANWMSAIERRVGVTASMIGAMKGMRLSGLSRQLSTIIQDLRLNEISVAGLYRSMLVYVVVLSYTPNALAPVVTFGAYTSVASKEGTLLDSTRIFTSLSLLSLITEPLNQLFHALPEFFAALACFGRIQKFLLAESRQDSRECLESPSPSIFLKSRSSSSENKKDNVMELKVLEAKALPVIEGPAILIQNGNFGWKRDDKPVLQEINLEVATSKLTMLIGQVGCGKTTLLKAMLGETPIAEGRVVLSSRNIAFCDQTPWLTNSTLQQNITAFSKYDPKWYASVVRACALEEDIAQLANNDQCMIGSKGIALSGGQKQRVAIARAVYSRQPIAIFDDVLSGLDSDTQKHVFDNVFGAHGLLQAQGTTIVLATHAVHLLSHADSIIALERDGKVAVQATFATLNVADGYLSRYGLEAHDVESPAITEVNEESKVSPLKAAENSIPNAMDDGTRQLGDLTIYKYYFSTVGVLNTVVFFGLLLVWVVMLKFPEIWLKWWGDSNMRHSGQENGKYLGVYTVFQIMSLASLAVDARHLIMNILVRSGVSLHSTLLTTVVNAPMSFFATTDAGNIINRFSQDIQMIDAQLPIALLNTAANAFVCLAQAIMIIPVSYWLVLAYPFLFGALYAVQKYYLRTSRQLRFLDLEAKSPIYSQFLETLGGLATIRAFSWEDDFIRLNEERLDWSQKPFYLLSMIQRWLNLVLDLIAAALAIILTAVAISLRETVSPGFTGVALYNIMTLSSAMKAAINVWTVLETSVGAVARVRSFAEETANENLPGESHAPPDNWPEKGSISIENVTAAYIENGPNVLNKTTLSINAGEKVGICGRSGSGKSSLVLALFRMIELSDGKITIDGLDISSLPRKIIRERLNALPQEPFFLKGSVRQNCDPQESSSDEDILSALRKVCIWDYIETKGGLDAEVSQDFFSHGQKQLFCLARALLHGSKIVIMDEATSSVDVDTDKILQELVRTAFKDATIIAVAHRLETILDFDNVALIDNGVVVEYGNPQQLLARPSAFKALYETYRKKSHGSDEHIVI